MNIVVENLLALQELVLQHKNPSIEQQKEIEMRRTKIPEGLLTPFDRWMARRRKAVAVVNNGVCGECHLRLTVGTMAVLAFGDAIQRCGNCGRFLYLPENEPVSSPAPEPPTKPDRFSKKASAHGR